MTKIHRPTAGQAFVYTCLPSDVVPDPSSVASGVLILRGPRGDAVTLSATLAKTTTAAVLTRQCDPSTGEAQTKGTYSMWAVLTLASGATVIANNNPAHFQVVEDWEDVSQC